jgi:tRNA1(Val) A37 N6-methylase TrmN6
VIDTGCGAGTFLVRAYFFLKHFHPELTHQQLLNRLWGVEIAPFPAFLATMNLALLDVANLDNYPAIIQKDFVQVEGNKPVTIVNPYPLAELAEIRDKRQTLPMPMFDACIGNPPYIRQELINNKELWLQRIVSEFEDLKENEINRQSDLYLYFLIHTVSLLKEGGRLGYVISASWLDVQFGTVLQKFLLDHFKIIAIIDQQKVRSFETASVNTIILIAEKCADKALRQQNNVAFVRIRAEYEQFMASIDRPERIFQVQAFAQLVEQPTETLPDYLQIRRINQLDLEQLSLTDGGTYTNGNWGATFLRAPEIYFQILQKTKGKFIPLKEIADLRYGIKTGNNDFFYMEDWTEKALHMSREDYELHFGVPRMGKNALD